MYEEIATIDPHKQTDLCGQMPHAMHAAPRKQQRQGLRAIRKNQRSAMACRYQTISLSWVKTRFA
ncbi:MAG: hypothetical protein WA161_16190 [Pseudomonas sp.]|uniref:hypothetical protein n=1 Tax=Pseudomonas sp. TaxID=306 RepID=UPI003BB68DB7